MYLEQWERCYSLPPKYAARPDESRFVFVKKIKALFKKYSRGNELRARAGKRRLQK